MELLELTLATPEENLALDEALLDEAEAAGRPSEVLRLWESILPAVVVGRSSAWPLKSAPTAAPCGRFPSCAPAAEPPSWSDPVA